MTHKATNSYLVRQCRTAADSYYKGKKKCNDKQNINHKIRNLAPNAAGRHRRRSVTRLHQPGGNGQHRLRQTYVRPQEDKKAGHVNVPRQYKISY